MENVQLMLTLLILGLNGQSGFTYSFQMAANLLDAHIQWLFLNHCFVFQKLRTVGNMFIVNLSIADLWVSGFVNPFGITGMVY